MKRLCIVLISLILLPNISFSRQFDVQVDLIKSEYFIKADHTYEQQITKKITLLTPAGVQRGQTDAESFSPDTQELYLSDAFVLQPDGTKVNVSEENIFVRDSQHHVPGFTNNVTKTVVFPQLQNNSQAITKWRLIQKKPNTLEFNGLFSPGMLAETKEFQIILHMPKDFDLKWDKHGDFEVTDKTNKKERIITATLKNFTPEEPENFMTHDYHNSPFFVASAIPSWESIGEAYWGRAKNKVRTTSEVKKLSKEIVGEKIGLEAAQLLYNWVAQNIHYQSVSLEQSEDYTPHDVMEIIKNGYGDCKDNVVLLQSLLQAVNIKSHPVMISAGVTYDVPSVPTEIFNHAIIYLPQYDLFTDPTNEYESFGILGKDSSNKFVIIADKKSKTMYTPETMPNQNKYSIKSKIKIDEEGNITGENTIQIGGKQNTTFRSMLSSYVSTTRLAEEYLSSTQEGGTGDLTHSDPTDLNRHLEVQATWTSPSAVNMEQNAFFATPLGIDFMRSLPLRSYITKEKRNFPTYLHAEVVHWEYEISIPESYKVTHLPKNIKFKNDAGEYQSNYTKRGHKIVVKRDFVLNKDVYSPEEYADFKELLYKPINDGRAIMAIERS